MTLNIHVVINDEGHAVRAFSSYVAARDWVRTCSYPSRYHIDFVGCSGWTVHEGKIVDDRR